MLKQRLSIAVISILPVLLLSGGQARADFNWGGDCDAGNGQFAQSIAYRRVVTVGTIPAGKRNVRIELSSAVDVDIQVVDSATGHRIIAWPDGDLNQSTEGCTTFENVDYCYSGYDGTNGQPGHEWIEIHGNTNRALIMRAYGYVAGQAQVDYSWEAVSTCREKGSGTFNQAIRRNGVVEIGKIPIGKTNIAIRLQAQADLDVQLFDGNVAIVRWPNGILNGPAHQETDYDGMHVVWSGYNGDGTSRGNESVEIIGKTTRELTMKAFGYQAGTARVDYEWGVGVGATCGGIAALMCKPGLDCKEWPAETYPDVAGVCHTSTWCQSNETARGDCRGLPAPAVLGRWTCESFECKYVAGCANNDPRKRYVGDTNTCMRIRFVCEPGTTHFSDDCGCGCMALTCSLADQSCAPGFTCEIGCPTPGNCGINPPGVCRPMCGGEAGAACAQATDYCDFGSHCGYADQAGVCRARPEACTQQYDPVCGCDGQTHGNACMAANSGQSVREAGECQ